MATIANKIAPVALDIDAQGEKLLGAMTVKGEQQRGATQKAVDYFFSALGWRTETIKSGVDANKGRREQMKKVIVANFSQTKQTLLAPLGEDFEGLTDADQKKFMAARKAAQQSIGPYITLIESGIKKLEDAKKPAEEKEAEEKEAKAKNTDFAKIQKSLQTVLEILQGMKDAPAGVDIPVAVDRVKALKGGLPSV